ncbi:MAG: hypothetical protein HRT57_11940 [Crocinitomicaceae bacterium]|nr:hypothetical protein [Crocinitomicaceae bacterium]
MRKPVHKKKKRKTTVFKEDSKQDLIFANYLIEDITAFESLLPKNENDPLSEELTIEILASVKKTKSRLETFSTVFRTKYDSVRFNKLQSICKAFLRSGKENPRYRYAFLLKELTAGRQELYKHIG